MRIDCGCQMSTFDESDNMPESDGDDNEFTIDNESDNHESDNNEFNESENNESEKTSKNLKSFLRNLTNLLMNWKLKTLF